MSSTPPSAPTAGGGSSRLGRSLAAVFLLLALALLPAILHSGCRRPSPPHIILVLLDALRADHLGCYGYDRPTTPFLDRLARRGVQAETALAQAPSTKASVASLLTSLTPSVHKTIAHGVREVEGDALPPAAVTLAERLAEAGYRTAGFVGNPHLQTTFGFHQGFGHYRYLSERKVATAEEVVGAALRWLDEVRPEEGRPLFLYLHLMDTHHPYDPPPPWRDQFLHPRRRQGRSDIYVNGRPPPPVNREDALYLRDLYDGGLRYADDCLARFCARLAARGLLADTLLVVVADHGEEFLDRGGLGHGTTLHQEQLRVPLLLVLPGRLPAGRVLRAPVALVDLVPTILSAAGVGWKRGELMGRDLLPLLAGRRRDPGPAGDFPPVLSERSRYQQDLVAGRHKLVFQKGDPSRALQLFDLQADPAERMNLLWQEAETAGEMAERAAEILEGVAETDRRLGLQRTGTRVEGKTKEQLRRLGYVE